MTWAERIEAYKAASPWPASLAIGEDGRLFGMWEMGNDYRVGSGYCGGYPPSHICDASRCRFPTRRGMSRTRRCSTPTTRGVAHSADQDPARRRRSRHNAGVRVSSLQNCSARHKILFAKELLPMSNDLSTADRDLLLKILGLPSSPVPGERERRRFGCELARNNDPLRGFFRVQSRPL